ncbi:MAG: anti-sigma B factor RsbW [Firmicutes bacterium]|nr:anti-sigma B factor RsbW [Bacillota bacterium]
MDEINIKLPAKPEYVLVARLTTSAIASRLGFSVDEIEDLKVAVSESSIFLMNQFSELGFITIDYKIHDNCGITAHVKAFDTNGIKVNENAMVQNELSLFIIESIVDRITKDVHQGIIQGFSIYKTCGGQS